MAVKVPDTTTFSLQDVFDSVNDHASPTGDLADCFAKALADGFDPAYAGYTANSMLLFRNYPLVLQMPELLNLSWGSAITNKNPVTYPFTPVGHSASGFHTRHFLGSEVPTDAVKSLTFTSVQYDAGVIWEYNGSQIQAGQTVDFSAGLIYRGSNIYTTTPIVGVVKYTMDVEGYGISPEVTFTFSYIDTI